MDTFKARFLFLFIIKMLRKMLRKNILNKLDYYSKLCINKI